MKIENPEIVELTENQYRALTALLSDWDPERKALIISCISHRRSQASSSRDSGASLVLALRILPPGDFAGAAIAKLEQVSSTTTGVLIADNNLWALGRLPGYVPPLIDGPVSDPTGQICATLYQWAGVLEGADVTQITTLAQLISSDNHEDAVTCLTRVAAAFLGNPEFYGLELDHPAIPAYELLAQTINWGKDRIAGRNIHGQKIESILDRLKSQYDDPDEQLCPRLVFFNDLHPNPLAYAYKPEYWRDKELTLWPKGPGHGDLHCSNIVYDTGSGRKHPYVIDWDTLSHDQLVFFDHAYLELDILLRSFQIGNPDFSTTKYFRGLQEEGWRAAVGYLSGTGTREEPHNLFYRQAQPYLKILQQARQTLIASWSRHAQGYTLSLRQTYSLAAVAASMNFVRKSGLTQSEQMYILYYGSQYLQFLLDALEINWHLGCIVQFEFNRDIPPDPMWEPLKDPREPLAEVRELHRFYDNQNIKDIWRRLAISCTAHTPYLFVLQGERVGGKTSWINVITTPPADGGWEEPDEGKYVYVDTLSLFREESISSISELLGSILNRILSQTHDRLQSTGAPLVRESLQNLQTWANKVMEDLEGAPDKTDDLFRCFYNAQNIASDTDHLTVVYFDEPEVLEDELPGTMRLLLGLADLVDRLIQSRAMVAPIAFIFAVNRDSQPDSLYAKLRSITDRASMDSAECIKLKPLSEKAAQDLYLAMVQQLKGPDWLQKRKEGLRWATNASQNWAGFLKLLVWHAVELARRYHREPGNLSEFFQQAFSNAMAYTKLDIRMDQYYRHYLNKPHPESKHHTTAELLAWTARWPPRNFNPYLDGINLEIWRPHLEDAFNRDLLQQHEPDMYWPHPVVSAWIRRVTFHERYEGLEETPPPTSAQHWIWIHKKRHVVFINNHDHGDLDGNRNHWKLLLYLAEHQQQEYCSYNDLFSYALEMSGSKNVGGYVAKAVSALYLQLDKVNLKDRAVIESVKNKGYCIPQGVKVMTVD